MKKTKAYVVVSNSTSDNPVFEVIFPSLGQQRRERYIRANISGSVTIKPIQSMSLKEARVTMTTESCKNGAITLSRINFSGYKG